MVKHRSQKKSQKRSRSQKKSQKRSQRRSQKKSQKQRRSQRGGSCAAMPLNRESFGQRGGMSPYSTGDSYLLDAPTRVQAEVSPLDSAFSELPSVIPRQSGGRRQRSRRSRSRRQRSQRSRRQQRGGMSPYTADPLLLDRAAYSHLSQNPQFHTEAEVNSLYNEFRGPQQ
jgi:hypothetical protein